MTPTFGYRELLSKEVFEAWRTDRLSLLCGLFTAVGVATPVLVRFLPGLLRAFGADGDVGLEEPDATDALAVLVQNLGLLGGIAAVLLTMGAVAGERRRGTLVLILSRPVGPAAIVWAKFVALGMAFGVATALALLGAWLFTAVLFVPPPVLAWAQTGAVLWLALMVTVAVTLAGSVAAPTPLGAAFVGLAFLGAMSLAAIAPPLARLLPAGLPELAVAVGRGDVGAELSPVAAIVISLGVIALALAVAWRRFRGLEP